MRSECAEEFDVTKRQSCGFIFISQLSQVRRVRRNFFDIYPITSSLLTVFKSLVLHVSFMCKKFERDQSVQKSLMTQSDRAVVFSL